MEQNSFGVLVFDKKGTLINATIIMVVEIGPVDDIRYMLLDLISKFLIPSE